MYSHDKNSSTPMPAPLPADHCQGLLGPPCLHRDLRMSETQAEKAIKGYFVQNPLFLAYPSISTLIPTTLSPNSFNGQNENPGLRISRLGSLLLHHCCVATSRLLEELRGAPLKHSYISHIRQNCNCIQGFFSYSFFQWGTYLVPCSLP